MSKIVFLGIDLKPSMEGAERMKDFCSKFGHDLLVCHTERKKLYDFPDDYDIGIAFMYRHLVPKAELEKADWINIHPAPLPKYGGRNVAYHAILNEEKEFGASIHYMEEKFDKGDIISTSWFDIPEDITANELYELSCKESLKLFDKYLPKLINRTSYLFAKKQIDHKYYNQCEIDDFISIDDDSKKRIRALYAPPYYPKIKIGNRIFNIILEE